MFCRVTTNKLSYLSIRWVFPTNKTPLKIEWARSCGKHDLANWKVIELPKFTTCKCASGSSRCFEVVFLVYTS